MRDSNLITTIKSLFQLLTLKENDSSSQHYVFSVHRPRLYPRFMFRKIVEKSMQACNIIIFFSQMSPCQCQSFVSFEYVFCSFRSITMYLSAFYVNHQLNGIDVVYCFLSLISEKYLVSTAECYTLTWAVCINTDEVFYRSVLVWRWYITWDWLEIIEKYFLISLRIASAQASDCYDISLRWDSELKFNIFLHWNVSHTKYSQSKPL